MCNPVSVNQLYVSGTTGIKKKKKKRKEKDMIYTSVLRPVVPCIYNAAIVATGLNATLLPLANPMAHLLSE
ncbi:hypothetical protein NC653_015010 [Populus alba x Populus x berolinensis]|uniref:Uncharacterized protein n=1 Tax=Populus alba x Populus x berolinensis TaxID=444605 RepID=A0AAD6QYI0_9ROSI|nr:hypothetical protein NC653_015010 [Populus alba x Populus x berolinensis]